MAEHPSNDHGPHKGKVARLVRCTPQKCVGAFDGERFAEMILLYGGQELPPMLFRLPELRSLVSAAIYVLIRCGDEYGHALARAVRADDKIAQDFPAIAPHDHPFARPPSTNPTRKNPKSSPVIPSIAQNGPQAPISDSEALLFQQMLKNVKSHEDFMRFVGAEIVPLDASERMDGPKNGKKSRPEGSNGKKKRRPK